MLVNINLFFGSLLYAAIKSRPDIAYVVNQASRKCEHPTTIDDKALLMILQYLKVTIHKSIHYNGKNKLVGFQMLTMQMTKLQEDQLVVIYFNLVIVLFHRNLKFKEMLLFPLLKLNLLV